jgi:hypothetical protein
MSNRDVTLAMTPWEYAHYLQEEHFAGQQYNIASDVCDMLASTLLGSLPSNQRQILEQVPVIVLPTKDPNASAIAVPGGGSVIAVDYGLLSLLTALNKLVLCRLNIFGFEPSLDLSSAAKMAKQAIENFLLGSDKPVPRWAISPKKMLIASALGNLQAAFVIGHELGHILLNHLGPLSPSPTVKIEGGVVIGSKIQVSFNDSHEMEFAADRHGATMVLDNFRKIYDPLFGPNEPAYNQAGVDILFSYFELIRLVSSQPSASHTHASPTLRRQRLRDFMWSKIPETSRELAAAAEIIVNSFASISEIK